MLKELLPGNRFEEVWAGAARSPEPLPVKDRVLFALETASRGETDPLAGIRSILGLALEVSGSERVYFFDVPQGAVEEPPVLGQCLASINLDLEPIRDPEAKAPLALLKEVLRSRRALFVPDLEADPRWQEPGREWPVRVRALGAVVLAARGRAVGVLYFDHRFKPLALEGTAAVELAALSHVLALLHQGERLWGENRSLWKDVVRLKERGAAPQPEVAEGRPARPRGARARFRGDYSFIVGSSGPMLEIYQLLDRVAGSTAPVLINGESGSGKELVARAVHANSPRQGKPFVSENCGALTETLLESELFGYVKGAFTGASKDRQGLFELADSGSLFLDEVGDMSPSMQKKLLRVLQESVIRRVGGKDYQRVDVRLICATNKDLLEECRQGRFREDLYYRLNVINIKVPALRDRREDIPELVEHFLAEMARQGGAEKRIQPEALKRLQQHSWPGNIRELQNEVKRFHALSEGTIGLSDLSETILKGDGPSLLQGGLERELADLPLREATERLERELIRRALFASRGNKSLVAKKLQIPKTSLYNKINKYQLEKDLP